MLFLKGRLVGAVALLIALSASSHHSAAMFDLQKEITLTGTVRVFQFNNPHCFIQLVVLAVSDGMPNSAGEWSIEMGAPTHLMRHGWKPNTLRPGDKLSIVINPLKDGGNGGNYLSAIWPNGKIVGAQP